MIPYGKQSINQEDIDAVIETLQSSFLTCGPQVEAFEEAFASFIGAKHAIALNNATSALHLALLVAGIGPGDRVITSPNTFLSSANCAAFVGATPDFCDIELSTYTMDAQQLAASWQDDTKAVIPVAYAGQSAHMPAIASIAREKGALIIEDACHGTGGGFFAEGKAWKQGAHPWADMTVFSFHPVKTLTTGEGGMLTTNDDALAAKARLLRTHGMERSPEKPQGLGGNAPYLTERGTWYYEMTELGYNFRITDFQCALGLSQLKRLEQFMARRRTIVAAYNEAFKTIPWIQTPQVRCKEDRDLISWHLYTTQIDFDMLGMTRTQAMEKLRAMGIGSQVLYIPVHLQPYYRNTYGYGVGKCPRAEHYYAKALSLPLYPAMSDTEVSQVIAALSSLSD